MVSNSVYLEFLKVEIGTAGKNDWGAGGKPQIKTKEWLNPEDFYKNRVEIKE